MKTDLQIQKEFKPNNIVEHVGEFAISYEMQTEKPYKNSTPYKTANISIYDANGSFFGMAIWNEFSKTSLRENVQIKINKLLNIN